MIVSDDRVARFVGERLGAAFVPPYTCMGIERAGKIVAGVIFNVFEGCDVHVTVAGSGWTRDFLSEVGHYVFTTLGKERMTAITERPEVVKFGERLGGKVEGLLRSHLGKGRDAFVIGILKDDYPW